MADADDRTTTTNVNRLIMNGSYGNDNIICLFLTGVRERMVVVRCKNPCVRTGTLTRSSTSESRQEKNNSWRRAARTVTMRPLIVD